VQLRPAGDRRPYRPAARGLWRGAHLHRLYRPTLARPSRLL